MNEFSAALACFAVTVAAMLALRPLAIAVDLVDRPGGRKTHHGEVPIVGGLAMFLGITIGIGLVRQPITIAGPLLSAFGLMVLVGLLDDRFGLSPWMRLPFQITAAAIAVFGTDTSVATLGDPLGLGTIQFEGLAQPIAAIVLIVAAINAFNMLDGMDGLAGITAIVGFIALGCVADGAGLANSPRLALILTGAVAAFLVFSAPLRFNDRLRCFMGDAGSTFLGLALAWLCLRVSQCAGDRSVSPVTVLWLTALPVYELISSCVRRMVRGKSPFAADDGHFHHVLIRSGFSVRAAFLVFGILATLFASTGVLMERVGVPENASFLLFVTGGTLVVAFVHSAHQFVRFIPSELQRLPSTQPTNGTSARS